MRNINKTLWKQEQQMLKDSLHSWQDTENKLKKARSSFITQNRTQADSLILTLQYAQIILKKCNNPIEFRRLKPTVDNLAKTIIDQVNELLPNL